MRAPITLAVAGDVMLGRLVNEAIAREGFAYPWGNVVPTLRQADLFLINLECALTTQTERWHDRGQYKPFYFRAEPSVVETLKIGRVDFASLANNHAVDFGIQGMLDTVAVLDQAGIAHAGAGRDLAAARVPARLAAAGLQVTVLAFADYPLAWAATPTSPGISYTPVSLAPEDFASVEGALADARQQGGLVIFSIHWGPNMRSRPTQAFRDFAYRVIDAGADIFWGHSAHVAQGIEIYGGKLILYDTGDFVDDYAVTAELRNDLSALFLVRIESSSLVRVELIPVSISKMQVNLAAGQDREWFVQRLRSLCAEMGTELMADKETVSVKLPD